MNAPVKTERAASIAQLRKFARLDQEKRALEDKLKAVKAEIEIVEPQVVDYFQRTSVDRITVSGITVYLRRELWAGRGDGVSNADFCAVLRANGLESFVEPKVNTQTLSAHIRTLDKAGEELAEPLAAVIKISEVFKIGTRKG